MKEIKNVLWGMVLIILGLILGGNALGNSPSEQLELVKKTAKSIVDLVESGADVVVSHGNGPQVGMINLGFSAGTKYENLPLMPFAECGAMSQGYIGYHLQQAISKELYDRKIKKDCATIITQVIGTAAIEVMSCTYFIL